MGLGDRLPFEVAKHVVPRLPLSLQRFVPSSSWEAAAAASKGYAAVSEHFALSVPEPRVPLAGNALATVAAFGVALSSVRASTKAVRVVDFGGGDGQFADLIESAFPDILLDWTVVELPSVVAAAQSRARRGLAFSDNLAGALEAPADITFASASLNYVPDPLVVLQLLLENSTCTVVTRLPLWPIEQHQAAVQRTARKPVEISYPTWFFSEKQFLADVAPSTDVLLDFICPNDRASFAGHYAQYRGLVLAGRQETNRVDA